MKKILLMMVLLFGFLSAPQCEPLVNETHKTNQQKNSVESSNPSVAVDSEPDKKDKDEKIVSIVAIIFSMVALYLTIFHNKSSKRLDVYLSLNQRFDELQKDRLYIISRDGPTKTDMVLKTEITMYYSRYWSFQLGEFIAWKAGYLDDDLYFNWIHARWEQFMGVDSDWGITTVGFTDGFNEVARKWGGNNDEERIVGSFLAMMTDVSEAKSIDDLFFVFKKHRSPLYCRFLLIGHRPWWLTLKKNRNKKGQQRA